MPAIALAGAAREALRMADVLEALLRSALDVLDRGDRNQFGAAKGLDTVIDRLSREIKIYSTSARPRGARRRGQSAAVGNPRFCHQY